MTTYTPDSIIAAIATHIDDAAQLADAVERTRSAILESDVPEIAAGDLADALDCLHRISTALRTARRTAGSVGLLGNGRAE